MNNILSDNVIQKIYNYDTKQLNDLFVTIRDDSDFNKRKDQRLGVNNRLQLIPATNENTFGRDADGVPVYIRPKVKGWSSENEVLQKVHKDFPNIIATTKAGYLSGIEISSENKVAYDTIDKFLKVNNARKMHTTNVFKSCAYGVTALRLYSDKFKGITFSRVEPWAYAPFYDKTGRLVMVMQWTEVTKEIQSKNNIGNYKVNILTDKEDLYFYSDKSGKDLMVNSYEYPATVVEGVELDSAGVRSHSFKGVPFVEFINNDDLIGDVEKTLDSQDSRDELFSKMLTSMTAFSDTILVDETEDENGETVKLEDLIKSARDNALLTGKWKWLIKDYAGAEAVFNAMRNLDKDIFEGSNSYDPNSLGEDGSAPTKYQVQQKLKGLIDSSVLTEQNFEASYMELFRLVLTHGIAKENSLEYLDINLSFKHTVPEDKLATLKALFEMGLPISPERGYTEAGYKWEEEKIKLEEAKKDVINGLNEEVENV